MSKVQQSRISKLSHLVGVEVHLVEDRVEPAVSISLTLNLPCAISKYGSSGGGSTHVVNVQLLPLQGGRVYQDAQMIDARYAVLIEVVVEVHDEVQRRHNVEQSKGSRLVALGEQSTNDRSTGSGRGRKPHGCTTMNQI